MRAGDPVLPEHIKAYGYPRRYAHAALLAQVHTGLLECVPPGAAASFSGDQMPLWLRVLGIGLYNAAGSGPFIGALVHHGVQLGWHRDRQAPPGTWNITIILRPPGQHDFLVVGDCAWAMVNGSYLHFDNQRWHGTLAFEPTARFAVTYYVPAPPGGSSAP